jgi:gas vesicle protein
MSISSFISGMFTGLFIGLLLAPAPGAETRQQLGGRAAKLKDSIQDAHDRSEREVTNKLDKLNEAELDKTEEIYHELKS